VPARRGKSLKKQA